jgi:phage terminase large subunit-like protein
MQQIRGGGITMQGGQVLMITTQSDIQPTGVWKTELEKARRIRDGKGGSSPIMLPVLYEFPEELQRDEAYWRNRRNWKYLLPNIGRSIDPQRLVDDYENNGKVTKEAEQIWVSQHLNIEIGTGFADEGWGGAEFWDSRADVTLTLEALMERSEVAVVGADGGGLDDLFGVCAIGREKIRAGGSYGVMRLPIRRCWSAARKSQPSFVTLNAKVR